MLRLNFDGEYNVSGALKTDVKDQLTIFEEKYELGDVAVISESRRLQNLLQHLHQKTGQLVVVLVDEYDCPILDTLTNKELAINNREYLKIFYRQLKSCSQHIRFVFVTGITMFSKASLFSGLNHLNDISLDPRYNSICGYTDHDIDTVFAEEKVYNPYGVLLLFDKKKFKSWWLETGTPTYLYQYLSRTDSLNLDHLENCWVSREELTVFEIDQVTPEALFFQSGYLTITQEKEEERETWYLLTYPNLEVRDGVYHGPLQFLGTNAERAEQDGKELIKLLRENNFAHFKERLYSFLAVIPHQCY